MNSMKFVDYTNDWAKSEVYQGKIMIGIGLFLAIAFIAIFRSENVLLRGALFPMGLLLAILLGYGCFIIYSRPAHAKVIIGVHQKSSQAAIKQEIAKHENDNKAGKLLLRIYSILMLVSVIALLFVSSPHNKGLALGFVLLFISTFIIDTGFVTRSDNFLAFLMQ